MELKVAKIDWNLLTIDCDWIAVQLWKYLLKVAPNCGWWQQMTVIPKHCARFGDRIGERLVQLTVVPKHCDRIGDRWHGLVRLIVHHLRSHHKKMVATIELSLMTQHNLPLKNHHHLHDCRLKLRYGRHLQHHIHLQHQLSLMQLIDLALVATTDLEHRLL